MNYKNQEQELASFSELLRQALGNLINPAATTFVDMMSPTCVMEFPYAPVGAVRRLEGRQALVKYLNGVGALLKLRTLDELVVHHTTEPSVVIVEFKCLGFARKTDQPYAQQYISVITIKEGYILRYVDFWNPLEVIKAIGSLEAWLEAGRAVDDGTLEAGAITYA